MVNHALSDENTTGPSTDVEVELACMFLAHKFGNEYFAKGTITLEEIQDMRELTPRSGD